ncbi:MAG: endonuclease III [Lachnospiraceae bacterium]|nr:endonuclease III [Lachnospiraceae bacterium]
MNKDKVKKILNLLDENYGTEDRCFLSYNEPHELLIATIMSAQCTDERVNAVSGDLFLKYRSVSDFANAGQKDLEKDIHSVGFYHMKAKHIIGACRMLLSDFDGKVPSDIDELTSLPGVGRKTANVVRGHIFKIPSIVVDTHVKRVAKRLGLTDETDPEKVEHDLEKKIPKDHWILINLQLISHGRQVCQAKHPECEKCFLAGLCKNRSVTG